jgi:hypothetical protein
MDVEPKAPRCSSCRTSLTGLGPRIMGCWPGG